MAPMSRGAGPFAGTGTLLPPFRYAIVEEGLHRGACPSTRNFNFLKCLKLKTMISLVPQKMTLHLQPFCVDEGIELLHLETAQFKEEVPLKVDNIAVVLSKVIDVKNHPIYMHCVDGTHVVGLLGVMIRLLQRWTLSAAINEYTRFLREAVVSTEEEKFLKSGWKKEIIVPLDVPFWLRKHFFAEKDGGMVLVRHPHFKLKASDEVADATMVQQITQQVQSSVQGTPKKGVSPNMYNSTQTPVKDTEQVGASGANDVRKVSYIASGRASPDRFPSPGPRGAEESELDAKPFYPGMIESIQRWKQGGGVQSPEGGLARRKQALRNLRAAGKLEKADLSLEVRALSLTGLGRKNTKGIPALPYERLKDPQIVPNKAASPELHTPSSSGVGGEAPSGAK
eukprot:Clim_evm53s142 gene=Clim_evmTU53s142